MQPDRARFVTALLDALPPPPAAACPVCRTPHHLCAELEHELGARCCGHCRIGATHRPAGAR